MSEMIKDGNRTVIRDTLKPVIAQVFGVEPDSIDEIIIITRGECNSCDQRNMITLLDTITDDETFAEVMSNALITRVEGELFLCLEA